MASEDEQVRHPTLRRLIAQSRTRLAETSKCADPQCTNVAAPIQYRYEINVILRPDLCFDCYAKTLIALVGQEKADLYIQAIDTLVEADKSLAPLHRPPPVSIPDERDT